MAVPSAITSNYAKNGPAKSFGDRRKGLRVNSTVMQISRGLFPIKTAQHLADLTGYSVRSCEYWLSEKSVIPTDALVSLMQSDQGRNFLVGVMADSSPRWWMQLKAWIKSIDYRTAEIKQRRLLRELLDDAAGSAPSQVSASMLVQDEEFYRGVAPEMALPHRPVAQAKGQRR